MTDRPWKQTERAIARRLGGRRTGPTGRPGPDVTTDWLSVEVKTRKRLPNWLSSALEQARHGPAGRLPIVILHQSGRQHSGDLVLMTLQDFRDWFEAIALQLPEGTLGLVVSAHIYGERTLTGRCWHPSRSGP